MSLVNLGILRIINTRIDIPDSSWKTKGCVTVRYPMSPFNVSNTPAATAEPITPATLGPMACMSRTFWGSASRPSFWLTRAAIGTADTPAEPINGLILFLEHRFIPLAISTPDAVPTEKAMTPRNRIPRVDTVRNSRKTAGRRHPGRAGW